MMSTFARVGIAGSTRNKQGSQTMKAVNRTATHDGFKACTEEVVTANSEAAHSTKVKFERSTYDTQEKSLLKFVKSQENIMTKGSSFDHKSKMQLARHQQ